MKSNKNMISVVIPFYKGNQYIENLLEVLSQNTKNLSELMLYVEVIIVNDSPEEEISYDKTRNYPFRIRIITAGKNQGIHGSRIYGVRHAKGEYLLMLDQDDTLSDTWLREQYEVIGDCDMVISNAVYCKKRRQELVYSNVSQMKHACNKWTLCIEGNKIVSPGQVLIRKDRIPRSWLQHPMKFNGADDYLLWILMMETRCKVAFNLNTLYYHRYSASSVSNINRAMRKSEREMLDIILKYRLVNFCRRKLYKYRLEYH